MKKLFLILLTLLCISCNSNLSIPKFDSRTYYNDLAFAETMDISLSPVKFILNAYVIEDNENFIYTIQFSYRNQFLSNVRAIMIPEASYESEIIYPCIGYIEKVNLSEEKNIEDSSYPGFNLSYKSSNSNFISDFYISYIDKNNRVEFKYSVTNFIKLGE